MANLITDPSFEYNIAPTSVGTPTTSERSNTQVHSGSYSWKVIADAVDEGIQLSAVTVSGKFYRLNVWVYVVSGIVTIKNITLHKGSGNQVSSVTGAWQNLQCVFRATAATTNIQIMSNGAITFYVDDIAANILTDVSLTCTPASQANSLESGGIRVDGRDTLVPNPAISLPASAGKIRFRWIPRHSAADACKFGEVATPYLIRFENAGATDRVYAYWTAANILGLYIKANGVATVTPWDCTGLIVAGTTYLVELWWAGGTTYLDIDGINRITKATVAYAGPNFVSLWYGSNGTGAQSDIVILAP